MNDDINSECVRRATKVAWDRGVKAAKVNWPEVPKDSGVVKIEHKHELLLDKPVEHWTPQKSDIAYDVRVVSISVRVSLVDSFGQPVSKVERFGIAYTHDLAKKVKEKPSILFDLFREIRKNVEKVAG